MYTLYTMILNASLEEFGLTEKEAKVYLATLELGQDTVLGIAQKSELKRPTVYIVLESLIQRGLVHKVPKGTTTLYVAEDPDFLLSVIERRQKAVNDVIPFLKALYNRHELKPQIRFYEGQEGIKKVYRELRRAKEYIYFYGSIKDIVKNFSEEMLSYKVVKKIGIQVKEIMASDAADIGYAKEIVKYHNPKHEVRVLQKGTLLAIDTAIVDNHTIAILSLKDRPFGVIMRSPDMALSFKALFELAWQSALKVT